MPSTTEPRGRSRPDADRAGTEPASVGPRRRPAWTSLAERGALPAVWILLAIGFAIALPDTFLTGRNLSNILGSQAVIVVLTLGILIPLTAGDFDLSVAFGLTLSAMVIAILNAEHQVPIGIAILVALAIGAAIGLINGGLVVLLGIDSLIVTLGTGTFIGGVILWISDGNTISGVSDTLVNVVIVERVFGIPLEFFYGLALCIALWYLFEFTPLGRRLLFVGRGRNVARLAGVRVARIRWGALIASAVIGALAGVLYVGTTGAADPTSGTAYLLPAFAAAFLGSTTIMPGRFNPWGSIIAVYTLATGITGLQLLGVPSFVQSLFYGGALVLAVALSQLARRREERDVEPIVP